MRGVEIAPDAALRGRPFESGSRPPRKLQIGSGRAFRNLPVDRNSQCLRRPRQLDHARNGPTKQADAAAEEAWRSGMLRDPRVASTDAAAAAEAPPSPRSF